jgi:hypothetical protein
MISYVINNNDILLRLTLCELPLKTTTVLII